VLSLKRWNIKYLNDRPMCISNPYVVMLLLSLLIVVVVVVVVVIVSRSRYISGGCVYVFGVQLYPTKEKNPEEENSKWRTSEIAISTYLLAR